MCKKFFVSKLDKNKLSFIENAIKEIKPSNIFIHFGFQAKKYQGLHAVEKDAKIVVMLAKLGITDLQICENLGMESETFLRLKQQLGVAHSYRNHNYSRSWVVDKKCDNDDV